MLDVPLDGELEPLGIVNTWPIVKISLVKLLARLISSIDTSYALDIEYKLSPL